MTIKQKQWQLYFLGYYNGSIDGIWGEKSRSGTKQFQADTGLWCDGVFGYATENKSTDIIKRIQKAVGTTVDGLAGAKTKAATAKYQKKNGLTATGIADEKTRAKMGITDIKTTTTTTKAESTTASGDWWDEIKYFKRDEFKCKCGGRYCNGYPAEMKEGVVRVADGARAHFGAAGRVISGLRCPIHNTNEGGVSNSRHKSGKAIDLRIDGVPADSLLAYVKKQPGIRYAYKINSTNVHFDIT